ncbi:MAG: DUF2442 domain-containing protein [Magnetococcales bacterium]|nr:DUF2442 domain-containing protein [Magnetococcales bacterium]
MNPKIVAVEACEPASLVLSFANGERRRFDVSPYLDKGIFKELRDSAYFRCVRAVSGFVAWPRGQDFSPDTLYLKSIPLSLTTSDGNASNSTYRKNRI